MIIVFVLTYDLTFVEGAFLDGGVPNVESKVESTVLDLNSSFGFS